MQGLLDSRRARTFLALALSVAFLLVNLFTGSRSPVVWQDEVMFADPAANLALGRGFTTSAWFQGRDLPFAGNAPLYSICLSAWIDVFGLDITSVRAFNYLLILAVVWIGILALDRLGVVRSPWLKLGLAAMVLCGDGVAYSYRSGRYDCLGMVLIATLVLALTIPVRRVRIPVLALAAVPVPWTGLQLLPYLALLGVILLLLRGRAALPDLIGIGAGLVLGMASLVGFFQANGVWGEFLKSVSILSGAGRPLAGRVVSALAAPLTEPSSILLLAALGVGTFDALRQETFRLRSPSAVGVLAGILIPAALAFTGKYARYYCWMAYLPMVCCAAGDLQRGRTGRIRPVILSLLVLACLVGLPARLTVTAREWRLRDPRPVDAVVAAALRPSDWVYCDYEAYYPAKRLAAALFLPPYAGLMPEMQGAGVAPALTAADRDAINILILKPSSEEQALRSFGGRWTLVARYAAAEAADAGGTGRFYPGSQPYDLKVYRRDSNRLVAAP